MTRNIFITGTHTGIGKTYTCVQIIKYLVNNNYKVAYYKPIQTGNSNADSELIKKYIKGFSDIYCTYSLALPATPELAFEQENIIFNKKYILSDLSKLQDKYDYVIIEGAGGVYVPVAENYLISNLISDIQKKYNDLKVLVFSSNYLGTINHTGLTLEFLKINNINNINGFAFTPASEEKFSSETANIKVKNTNGQIIEKHTGIKYLGEVNTIEQELNNSYIIELLIK